MSAWFSKSICHWSYPTEQVWHQSHCFLYMLFLLMYTCKALLTSTWTSRLLLHQKFIVFCQFYVHTMVYWMWKKCYNFGMVDVFLVSVLIWSSYQCLKLPIRMKNLLRHGEECMFPFVRKKQHEPFQSLFSLNQVKPMYFFIAKQLSYTIDLSG